MTGVVATVSRGPRSRSPLRGDGVRDLGAAPLSTVPRRRWGAGGIGCRLRLPVDSPSRRRPQGRGLWLVWAPGGGERRGGGCPLATRRWLPPRGGPRSCGVVSGARETMGPGPPGACRIGRQPARRISGVGPGVGVGQQRSCAHLAPPLRPDLVLASVPGRIGTGSWLPVRKGAPTARRVGRSSSSASRASGLTAPGGNPGTSIVRVTCPPLGSMNDPKSADPLDSPDLRPIAITVRRNRADHER